MADAGDFEPLSCVKRSSGVEACVVSSARKESLADASQASSSADLELGHRRFALSRRNSSEFESIFSVQTDSYSVANVMVAQIKHSSPSGLKATMEWEHDDEGNDEKEKKNKKKKKKNRK